MLMFWNSDQLVHVRKDNINKAYKLTSIFKQSTNQYDYH